MREDEETRVSGIQRKKQEATQDKGRIRNEGTSVPRRWRGVLFFCIPVSIRSNNKKYYTYNV